MDIWQDGWVVEKTTASAVYDPMVTCTSPHLEEDFVAQTYKMCFFEKENTDQKQSNSHNASQACGLSYVIQEQSTAANMLSIFELVLIL